MSTQKIRERQRRGRGEGEERTTPALALGGNWREGECEKESKATKSERGREGERVGVCTPLD